MIDFLKNLFFLRGRKWPKLPWWENYNDVDDHVPEDSSSSSIAFIFFAAIALMPFMFLFFDLLEQMEKEQEELRKKKQDRKEEEDEESKGSSESEQIDDVNIEDTVDEKFFDIIGDVYDFIFDNNILDFLLSFISYYF